MLKQIYEGRDVHCRILLEKLGREPAEEAITESIRTWSDDFESGRWKALPPKRPRQRVRRTSMTCRGEG
jgi:hypothetical protein